MTIFQFDTNNLFDEKWLAEGDHPLSILVLKRWEGEDLQKMVNLILSNNKIFKRFFVTFSDLLYTQDLFPQHFSKFLEKFVHPENLYYYMKNIEGLQIFLDLSKKHSWFTEHQNNEFFCKALLLLSKEIVHIGMVNSIVEFLKDNTKLYYKSVDKLKIAVEMYQAVKKPQNVNQNNRNLCGMVVILSIWLMDDPKTCIDSFIQLLKTGSCQIPLPLKASSFSRDKDSNFSDIFLSAIKNASNRFGYSPALFEKFSSATEPGIICNLLNKIGNRNITEATKLLTTNNNNLPWFYFILDPNIYAKDHMQFKNKEESFKKLLNKYYDGHHIIMYITMDLGNAIKSKNQQIDATVADSILGVAAHHYVILKGLHYDKSNKKINVTIWTWGGEYQAPIDEDFFFEHYFGFISAEKKISTSEIPSAQMICALPGMA